MGLSNSRDSSRTIGTKNVTSVSFSLYTCTLQPNTNLKTKNSKPCTLRHHIGFLSYTSFAGWCNHISLQILFLVVCKRLQTLFLVSWIPVVKPKEPTVGWRQPTVGSLVKTGIGLARKTNHQIWPLGLFASVARQDCPLGLVTNLFNFSYFAQPMGVKDFSVLFLHSRL